MNTLREGFAIYLAACPVIPMASSGSPQHALAFATSEKWRELTGLLGCSAVDIRVTYESAFPPEPGENGLLKSFSITEL